MFCDLVGSTALSTQMDPEDLREVIAAYQKSVSETVKRFDGFVAKYMGDGVLIYFGYPRAHEDDAERATRAGLEVIAAVTDVPLAQARRWAVQRQSRPAESVEEVAQFFGSAATFWPAAQLSVRSQWFEIQGQLIRSDVSLQASGLIRRQDLSVRLQRLQFEPIPPSSPATTTAISTIP